MSKKTIICLWWLKDKNFKILIGTLSVKLRIGILKILIFMAIKLDCKESILKISSKELLLIDVFLISNKPVRRSKKQRDLLKLIMKYLQENSLLKFSHD